METGRASKKKTAKTNFHVIFVDQVCVWNPEAEAMDTASDVEYLLAACGFYGTAGVEASINGEDEIVQIRWKLETSSKQATEAFYSILQKALSSTRRLVNVNCGLSGDERSPLPLTVPQLRSLSKGQLQLNLAVVSSQQQEVLKHAANKIVLSNCTLEHGGKSFAKSLIGGVRRGFELVLIQSNPFSDEAFAAVTRHFITQQETCMITITLKIGALEDTIDRPVAMHFVHEVLGVECVSKVSSLRWLKLDFTSVDGKFIKSEFKSFVAGALQWAVAEKKCKLKDVCHWLANQDEIEPDPDSFPICIP